MQEKKERLEDVKNRAGAAIAYAVARSCEIRASQRSAFLSDLDALFDRVETAETLADMLRPIPFFLARYDEYGGDIASKKIEEFFEKNRKNPLTKEKDGIQYRHNQEQKAKKRNKKEFFKKTS